MPPPLANQPPRRRIDVASLALLAWAATIAVLHARTMIIARGAIVLDWIQQLLPR